MPISAGISAGVSAGISAGASAGVSAGVSVGTTSTSNHVLRGRDVLNSNLGTAYIEINGRMRRIFELRNISATVEMVKEEVMLINDVMTKHKCVAAKGSGTFEIYTGVRDYSTMIRDYINTHHGLYFTITFEMYDPESNTGRRNVTLYDCLIDQHVLGQLNTENGILSEEMGFTFDEYNINQDFNDWA